MVPSSSPNTIAAAAATAAAAAAATLQVVIRDLLLGTPPACNGLLCELLGIDPSAPFADPRLVIAAVALLICSPLLLLR
jgi:ammonia channel protein AmtB